MSPTVFCSRCGQAIDAGERFCRHCGQPQPSAAPSASATAPTAPGVVTPYSTAVAAPVRYAGFWVRVLALIIDAIIVSFLTTPLSLMIMFSTGLRGAFMRNHGEFNPADIALQAGAIALLVCATVAIKAIYEAALTSSSRQATVGKMALGLRVTDLNGQRITFARALGRFFAKYISSLTLGIGYVMAGFTERKQGLHDMIAGTLVVRSNEPPYAIVPPQNAPAT